MNSRNIIMWSCTVIILCITWPLVSGWIPIFGRHWLFVFLGSLLCVKSISFHNKAIIWLLIYSLINVLYAFLYPGADDSNFVNIAFSFFIFLFSFSFYRCYLGNTNPHVILFLLIINTIFLIYTTCASVFLNSMLPGVVREGQLFMNEGEAGPYAMLEKYGLTNYLLPHAVPVLIPPFAMMFRNKEYRLRVRLISALIIVCIILLAYTSSATTPLLLSIAITIVSLVVKEASIKDNFRLLITVMFLLFIFMNDSVLVFLLEMLGNIVGGEGVIYDRIGDLQNAILYNDSSGDLGTRQKLYTQSTDAFWANPLFGSYGISEIGGHAFLLDIFGKYGMIGGIPFVLMIFYGIKSVYNTINKEMRIYYILSTVSALCMIATKNMNIWYLWIFLFVMAPIYIKELPIKCQR